MLDIVNNAITNEIKEISKNDCELFKDNASSSEKLTFDWERKSQHLQEKAPYLFSVFSNVVCLREKQQNLPQMMTAMAVLLYGRSHNMNQLQYIIGFTLKKCGLSKESVNIFHDLGISVSHTSLQRKTKELEKQQDHQIQSLISTYTEEVKCLQSKENESDAEEQRATEGLETDERFRPMEMLVNHLGKRTRNVKFVGSSKKRRKCDQAEAKSRTLSKKEERQVRIEPPKPSEPERIVATLNEGKDNYNNSVVENDDCSPFNGEGCEEQHQHLKSENSSEFSDSQDGSEGTQSQACLPSPILADDCILGDIKPDIGLDMEVTSEPEDDISNHGNP